MLLKFFCCYHADKEEMKSIKTSLYTVDEPAKRSKVEMQWGLLP